MLFSRWFGRTNRSVRTYRPEIGLLEDRVVPTILRPPLHPAPVPPATHLQVVVPANVVSGQTINVIIEAEDAHNKIVPGFLGTVNLSLGTADPGATYPGSFTFT